MKRKRTLFLWILLAASLSLVSAKVFRQQETDDFFGLSYVPGKIVIQFSKEIGPIVPRMEGDIIQMGLGPIDTLFQQFRVHTIQRLFPAPKYSTPDLTRHFVIKFDESMNLDDVVNVFSSLPYYVEKVEKVGLGKFDGSPPNDSYFHYQWHLYQESDCDIDAMEAWDIDKGSHTVILAVADTGVDLDHPDLCDNIWTNEQESNGIPGYDDDSNGYTDDIYGWDFTTEDGTPDDQDGHGTHCAGIIAAKTNNYNGVVGIAGGWYPDQKGCQIMCLRIITGAEQEYPEMSYVASALVYATDMGATAINCSFNTKNDGGIEDALDYATNNGLLVVHGAGNNDSPNGDNFFSDRTDVLNVAATNRLDQKASYSNYGSWVDVAAPGGEQGENVAIYSTWKDGYYKWESGTSMAAPMVVGLAGLIKSERSGWGRQKIWKAIVDTTDYIDSPTKPIGSGRINAFDALKQTWGLPSAPNNLVAQAVSSIQINLSWKDNSNNESGFEIQRKKAGGTFVKIGIARKNATSYEDKTLQPETTFYYRVRAYNINGNSSFSNQASATTPSSPPEAPSNLNATADCWDVTLTWQDNSNNEDGFYIYRKTGSQYVQFDYVGPNITTYTDIGLWCGVFWCYKVSAYNSGGESALSPSDCVWTFPCSECGYPLSLELFPSSESINSGDSVTYTYRIANNGPARLTDVDLVDDQFGIIGTDFSLEKGEARTFVKTITLTSTSTNIAEATAIYTHNNNRETAKARASITVKVKL